MIFAIDNNRSVLTRLEKILEKQVPKDEIRCFDNSPEALAAAREERVSTAFLGVDLQEIDGLVLGRYLKDLNPYVNLIYMTE
ncbi:MAG: response regulator, partial [Eubacterium sp.]|nr:response regulator [Eubacterium sp.]